MFESEESPFGTILRNKVGASTFRLHPERGFRLMSWDVHSAGADRSVIHWPESVDPDVPFHKIRGGNPLLFPFPGLSYHKGVQNTWQTPDGRVLPMPMHGFARDGRFTVLDQSDHEITGQLQPDEAAREVYPFRYRFEVTYRFEELALQCILRLHNDDDQPIVWSAGHHFYFTLPWHPHARRADYQLHLESRKQAFQGPDGGLVLQRDRETCHDLSNTNLLGRNHFELRHRRVAFGPRGGEEDTIIHIGTDEPPAKSLNVVTWTEAADSPFYCVEPWMGPVNAAEHGKGLHTVQSGQTDSFSVEVSLF